MRNAFQYLLLAVAIIAAVLGEVERFRLKRKVREYEDQMLPTFMSRMIVGDYTRE